MNFKILCRSFEAPTKPYQIKQNQNRPRNDREEANFNILSPHGRTHTHTYGARFIVPSLTSLGGDNKIIMLVHAEQENANNAWIQLKYKAWKHCDPSAILHSAGIHVI